MLRFIASIALALSSLAAQAAVDVNKANQADLEGIKGIGPALSGKILEARKAGEFRNWPDLLDRVVGIGPGNAVRLSEAGLTVSGGGYTATGAKASGAAAKATKPAADRAAKNP